MTSKKMIYDNEPRQDAIRQITEISRNLLQQVCNTFNDLGIGELTSEDLDGIPTTTLSGKASEQCVPCGGGKSISKFSGVEDYIQERIIDEAMTSGIQIGNLKLSRSKVKELVQMPAEELIHKFELAWKQWNNRFFYEMDNKTMSRINFSSDMFLSVEWPKVIVKQEAMEAFCNAQKVFAVSADHIGLLDDLEAVCKLINSVNSRLRLAKYGTDQITLTNSKGNLRNFLRQRQSQQTGQLEVIVDIDTSMAFLKG